MINDYLDFCRKCNEARDACTCLIEVDLGQDGNACHWGVTDMYDKSEKILQELLDSKGDFISYGSVKKELSWIYINRIKGKIAVSVLQRMDEDDDLIYDALTDVNIELSDEELDDIQDSMLLHEISSESEERCVLDIDNPTIDDIKTALNNCAKKAEKNLKYQFNTLKEILKEKGYPVTNAEI